MYKRILVPVDLGELDISSRALDTADNLAIMHNAELHVVTVVPTYTMSIVGSLFPRDFEKSSLAAAKKALGEFLAKRNKTGPKAKGHILHGTIYDEIMKAADKLNCDLIILASHRPALKDYLLGPNAARVVRHAKQSVFVVREQA